MSAANFEGIDMHGIEPLPSGKFRVRFIRKKRPVGDIVDTIEGAIKLRDALREELALGEVVAGAPIYGILDRLDRDADGSLAIVDYKTGALPNRNYDIQTFANTELYAALCEAKYGERPASIRLMYVAHGTTIERSVTDVVVRARATAAAGAWTKIKRYYDDGEFPATPSSRACRFCSYKDLCRSEGVPVPGR